MQLTINGTKYDLYFGVRFVRELDKIAGVDIQGASFGLGLTKSLLPLRSYDPAVLSDVLYAATATDVQRPTRNEVDDFIDSGADLEPIFDQVQKEMSEANAVKLATKNMKA
ncbi:MAG: tail assembly chaperone [Schleiferilactobacillus perolens]|uniref:tail assembly chaperone n=1 Tax=Schleiferilactobacillus perolens TaxID=100468 RepID=UPI0039EAAC28